MLSDSQSVAAKRQAILDDIQAAERAIIELKGSLNTLTDIARLPPELLSEVFLHVAKSSYEERKNNYHPYYGGSRFYAWITVSHVCRNWRAVALNTPRLWGHIILTSRPVVESVLARSKKAPLLICASLLSTSDDRGKLLEEIMQESPRLNELRLSGSARLLQDLCSKMTGSADHLETIVLSETTSSYYHSDVGDSFLSPTLFNGHLPRLRSLEIRRLVFAWGNPIFTPTITRLILSGRLDSQSLLGTFEQLLTTLERLSALQVLELEDSIPRLPEDAKTLPAPQRTITLPHLRNLTLSGKTLDCAHLFSHLSLSQATRVILKGCGANGAQELIRVTGEHLSRSKPLLTVQLSRMFSSKILMKGWRSVVDPQSPDPCLEVQIDALACSSLASYFVRDSKMFTKVRSLEIDSQYHDWRWKDVFAGMPELRILSIRGNPQGEFLPALSAIRKSRKNRPPSLVLPHLQVLKLSEVRMCSPDYDDPPEFLDDLEDWLLLRCNYNLPIDRLHLTQCLNLTEDDVERLVDIVPYVVWDKVVEFESEEDDEDEEDDIYAYDDYDYYEDGYLDDPWGFF
ncbi:hypothetical protein BV20DRAFT_968409 [Pilatotrama ljubarskyi]|nr:hypothetical protein BV20DRAFT_968409 [Pilatotrama ljubarskyi]